MSTPELPADERGGIEARLEEVLAGWETTDVKGLDDRCKALADWMGQWTIADIVQNAGQFGFSPGERWHLSGEYGSRRVLEVIKAGIDWAYENRKPAAEYYPKIIRQARLGLPIFNWLTKALENSEPEIQARAAYIAFRTENPFVDYPSQIYRRAEEIFRQGKEYAESRGIEFPQADRHEQIIKRMAAFLGEARAAASLNMPSAFAYSKHRMMSWLAFFDISPDVLEKNPKLKAKSNRCVLDVIRFCHQGMFYPPQAYYAWGKCQEFLPDSPSGRVFHDFYDHAGASLFEATGGELMYVVASTDRLVGDVDWVKQVTADWGEWVFGSFFSGPPANAVMEAGLMGAPSCVSVDALKKEAFDTDGVLRLEAEFSDQPLVSGVGGSPVEVEHIAAVLPQEWDRVIVALSKWKRMVLKDAKGGMLYLNGQELLDHLINIFKLGNAKDGTVVILDMGVPRSLAVRLGLVRQTDGGYRVAHGLYGLPIDDKPGTTYFNLSPVSAEDLIPDMEVGPLFQKYLSWGQVVSAEVSTQEKIFHKTLSFLIDKYLGRDRAYGSLRNFGPIYSFAEWLLNRSGMLLCELRNDYNIQLTELREVRYLVEETGEFELAINILEWLINNPEEWRLLSIQVVTASRVSASKFGLFYPNHMPGLSYYFFAMYNT